MNEMKFCQEMIERYPQLEVCGDAVKMAVNELLTCFYGGGRLLVCGNGGSAADSAHIVGELAKGFLSKRPLLAETRYRPSRLDEEYGTDMGAKLADKLQQGLPAHDLCENLSLNTAAANDLDGDMIYAQGVMAYGRAGDVLLAISTSGNALNTAYAVMAAKAQGMTTIGLTGAKGGKLAELCDLCIKVPETETFKVQELHLPVYHAICAEIEADYFDDKL